MFWPYLAGVASVGGVWILGGFGAGAWNPLAFVNGADGRPSSSKLQWLLWLGAAFFGYVALAVSTDTLAKLQAPQNLLLCLGFSAATMTAAKTVTVSYINSGRLNKRSATARIPLQKSLSCLLTDDSGAPDLSKLQMLAWTLLAIGAYLNAISTAVKVGPGLTEMPDVDSTLMMLMGLGQGGYLGKKLVTVGTDAVSRDPFALVR